MDLRDFLSFRRMITPVIIKILFWIGIGLSALFGIFIFFGGIVGGLANGSLGSVFGGLIMGPVVIVGGILSVRIYSELLILAFQVNETLTDIKKLLERG